MNSGEKLTAAVVITVPYHDADPAGVAWHGNYFRYFDLARCALLDIFDYGYKRMAESGYVWPVVDTRVRYIRPIYYHQKIVVRATLLESEYRLKIAYEIHDEEGEKLTKGYTTQVAVDANSGELCVGSPSALIDRLNSLAGNG
jgi:acyl-CoA thioester hydrolase